MVCDVIGLTGLAGSGKSTAAAYLAKEHGYTRLRFAGPLKSMMRCLGLDERHTDGDLKEVPHPVLCGRTPRHAMQTIGTEWGRDLIGPGLWVNVAEDSAHRVLEEGGGVVFEDVRFDNEAEMIRRLGGIILRVVGRGGAAGGHVSEAGISVPSLLVRNEGSMDRFHWEIEKVLAGVAKPASVVA